MLFAARFVFLIVRLLLVASSIDGLNVIKYTKTLLALSSPQKASYDT